MANSSWTLKIQLAMADLGQLELRRTISTLSDSDNFERFHASETLLQFLDEDGKWRLAIRTLDFARSKRLKEKFSSFLDAH